MSLTFPNRPTTTLPELQRDLVNVIAAIGPFALAKPIKAVSIATTETRVARGRRGVPAMFLFMPTSAGGPVRRSRDSDDTYLYLISAAGTVTGDVAVVP